MCKNVVENRAEDLSRSKRRLTVLFIAVFLSSFSSLGMELIWQRYFVFLFGSDSRSYAVVVAAMLIGISFGSWISGWKLLRFKTHLMYSLSLVAISAAIAMSLVVLQYGSRIETIQSSLDWLLLSPFYARIFLAMAVMFVPATIIGFAFPLVSGLWIRENGRIGSSIGKLYAVVAFGNVAGIFCCATYLIPSFGLSRSAVLLAVLPLLGAIIVLFLIRRRKDDSQRGLGLMSAANVVAAIGCGVLLVFVFQNPTKAGFVEQEQWDEVFYFEDSLQTVAVTESQSQRTRKRLMIDGVTIGESGGGVDEKQRLLAHLPFSLKAKTDRQKVYTIGLGTGILASELARHDCVDSVIATELSQGVIRAVDYFSDTNRNLSANSKVQILNDDGIRFLRQSNSQFDVIVSDGKSRPGAASNVAFFSKDYYSLCEDRLADDGLFVQWVSIKCSKNELATILKTFANVFPYGHVGIASPGSVYLVGSKSKLELDRDVIDQRMDGLIADSLSRYGWNSADDILSMYWIDQSILNDGFGDEIAINTFDTPVLEFYAWDSFRYSVQQLSPQIELLEQLIAADTESVLDAAPITANSDSNNIALISARKATKEILAANKLTLAAEVDWLDKSAARWKQALVHLPNLHRQKKLAQQYQVLAIQSSERGDETTEFSALLNMIELNCGGAIEQLRVAQILEKNGAFEQALPYHYAATKHSENESRFRIAFAECLMVLEKYGRANQQLVLALEDCPAESTDAMKVKLLQDICSLKSISERRRFGDEASESKELLKEIMLKASADPTFIDVLGKYQLFPASRGF